MDLKKIGKFIAGKRKEKGFTQEQLGEKLGISGNTISKWERGLNAPDISLLSEISSLLDISLEELLKGEKINEILSSKESNKSFIEFIKYYVKDTKKKYFKILLYIIFFITFIFSLLFLINNYNKFKIYTLESLKKNFSVSGYIIYNQEKNLIIINDIYINDLNIGTSDEEQIKYIKVSLKSKNKNIFSSEKNIDNINDNYLSSYLLNSTYFEEEDNNSNEGILINESSLKHLKMTIEYINIENKSFKIVIPLRAIKEYTNNKIIY